MATTTYSIQKLENGEFVEVDTKTKKGTAVEIAEQTRGLEQVEVRVVTNAGTVVFEQKAPTGKRVIVNKTKPYTRVDDREPELAEGVEIPEGFEVTYLLPRNKMSVCRDPETLEYLVLDHLTGETRPAANCRDASDVVKAIKAERKQLQNA